MSTWTPPARSAEALALYAAAEADRKTRPERYRLEPGAVLARALDGDGVAALGDDDWRAGFERYLASAAEDGRLNALGSRMAVDSAVGRLRARRAMARHLAAHPDVLARPIRAPIVITGGWRTGTTFLFRMLATDPRLRAPLPAELSAPWRFGQLDGARREAALDAAASRHALLHQLNPRLAVIHDSGARLPEECVLAMGTDFRNWGFTSTTRLDGYAAWLAGESFAGAYRRYRAMLQTLTSDGRRWLLKAPAHCAELASLFAAFPDACVVHLHRDVVATVASGASLFAVFRSTYSDVVDPADVGRTQTEQTALWLDRALAFRASDAARAARFVDLDYRALVADPIAAARRVYQALDLELPPDVAAGFERYRAAHGQHERGRHRYDPAQFGLDAGALRERFARYEERFALRTPSGSSNGRAVS
jgi:hypothetical protein